MWCAGGMLTNMFWEQKYTALLTQLLSHVWFFVTPWHARFPCASLIPGVCSSSCPLSQWFHPTILSSVVAFSLHSQSFPASGSFPVSWLFRSYGQNVGASASASVFPVNIQDWFPLGLTGWISLLSKGLSSVFFSTTIWKHQFLGTQLSLWSNSHIQTRLLEKP